MAKPFRAKYNPSMRDCSETWFDKSLEILTYNRNQMVWSILVTIFGDLARRPGDRISGSLLSRLTEPMGIKPEAVRVALHRLRNDGWITSERQGRTSRYSLTAHGLSESDAASPRIYAETAPDPDATPWHLLLGEPAPASQRGEADKVWRGRGYVPIAPGAYLGRGTAHPDSAAFLIMEGTPRHVPAWLRDKIGPPELAAAYRALENALDSALPRINGAARKTPVETAILRVVIVHNWRRALLAHPDLPAMFFPPDWRGIACREKVMSALAALPRPSLESLEERNRPD